MYYVLQLLISINKTNKMVTVWVKLVPFVSIGKFSIGSKKYFFLHFSYNHSF